MPAPPATVFFCHGSRSSDWRAPFDLLAADYQQRFPEHRVRLAFLELMGPTLPEVLADLASGGDGPVRIVPLFLAPGAHTQRDLPALLARAGEQWPGLTIEVHSTLLESDALRSAIVASI